MKYLGGASKDPLIYGISKNLEDQLYKNSNRDIKIVTNSLKNRELYLEFEFDEENNCLIDNIEIFANQNTKSTIYIKFIANEDNQFYHNGLIRVNAMENSEVNVIIVNMLNNKSINFITMENIIKDNARVNHCVVDFGGKYSIQNYFSNLIGQDSKTNLNTIYLGVNSQLFDINYIDELRGERSNANIEVQGALKDSAKKNFKGTVDFKKGAKKAKGNENEFCMLLSETAKSKALPMLLCTEEDVEGNHSSAAGKVEKDMLFYIMSRGFSYKEAMKLIVKARFNEIIEQIKDKELQQEIIDEIDKRLD